MVSEYVFGICYSIFFIFCLLSIFGFVSWNFVAGIGICVFIISLSSILYCFALKHKILGSFDVDGRKLYLVDESNTWGFTWSHRLLMNENGGCHSAISLSSDSIEQPCLNLVQKIVTLFFDDGNMSNALVLGCSGCAIPRFLIKRYKNIVVTGIEISPEQISIANKFFLNGIPSKQFHLIQNDARNYIEKATAKEKYQFIFCDLFSDSECCTEIYTQFYMEKVLDKLTNDGLLIINIGGISPASVDLLFGIVSSFFKWTSIARQNSQYNHLYIIASPSRLDEKQKVIESLGRKNDYTIIITRNK